MDNYIYAYYQKIEDGSIVVGKWIRLVFEIIIRNLEQGTYQFDQKKANRAIRFIETFCHHSEGPLAPGLIELALWQKAIVSCIFGIVDADGSRHFREVPILVARKNGKSLFASAISDYMLFMDGEYGARIFCVAPKLDQADIIYNDIWQTIAQEPELAERIRRRKSDYYVESTNSSVKKIAFNAKKSDGFNPSCTICDEISSWPGDQGLKQYEVMKSALGARKQPLILSCTTAGYINDGIYDELMKRSTRFLMGDSKESRLLPFLYMIDDPEKWNDINELRKSNPNLGVSVSVDYMLEEIAVAEGSYSKKAEFLTKYCNIKQNSSQAWLDTVTVNKCFGGHMELTDFHSKYAFAGIDLSQTTDLTACCVVIEEKGEEYVFCQFFLPEEKINDATERDGIPYRQYIKRGILKISGQNYVDYHDCFKWFTDLIEKYEIYPLQVGIDRYCAQFLQKDLEEYGFHCDTIGQGFNLTPVLRQMEGLFKDGKVHCGDNDLLKIHFLDAALKADTEMDKIRLIKMAPTAHIDGMAALSDAFAIRMFKPESEGQLRNEG